MSDMLKNNNNNNNNKTTTTTTTVRPFNSLFSRTTWISQHQKGKTSLDLNKEEMMGFVDAVDQMNHKQTICTSLQTDNHTNT